MAVHPSTKQCVPRVVYFFLACFLSDYATAAKSVSANGTTSAVGDDQTRPVSWFSMDLAVHIHAGGEKLPRIQGLAVQQPVLCSFLASLGPSAVEQSRALCGSEPSDDEFESTHEPEAHVDPRRLQGSSTASTATTCPVGTTAAYADEDLGFRFRSEHIATSADGSLRWDATVPSGLAFTMARPPDPMAVPQNLYTGVNYSRSEPSRIVPPGVAAGLYFDSGPEAAYDQIMYSNLKLAIGAENTFFAVLTPSSESAGFWGSVLSFRPGDGAGCVAWLMASFGCPDAAPGQVNENATGCVSL
jgi:hypothetical protein